MPDARSISWLPDFVTGPGTSVILQNQTSATRHPGTYEDVQVHAGSTLTLSPGVYRMRTLQLEPQSTLRLNDSGGPVVIYVSTGIIWRGTIVGSSPNSPAQKFLVVYGGTSFSALEKPFKGTLVASQASVRLGVGGTPHSGAFFAQQLEVDPDVQVTHVSFAHWDEVLHRRELTRLTSDDPVCDGGVCCPGGMDHAFLDDNANVLGIDAADLCIVAKAGDDKLSPIDVTGQGRVVVLAGSGNDLVQGGEANDLLSGSEGDDTLLGGGGVDELFGGPGDDYICGGGGDDTIVGGPGNDTLVTGCGHDIVYGGPGSDLIINGPCATESGFEFMPFANPLPQGKIVPGPGVDTVKLGPEDDTVYIYDLCEIGEGESLDGGDGEDTLIAPVSKAELEAMGLVIDNFENVIIEQNSCSSECVTRPDCSGHGECAEGSSTGAVVCQCDTDWDGTNCSIFLDDDGDDVGNSVDNCPSHENSDQEDTDGDGIGDVCDVCPERSNPRQEDRDGDDVGDVCDNCVWTPNSDQDFSSTDPLENRGDACRGSSELVVNTIRNGLVTSSMERRNDIYDDKTLCFSNNPLDLQDLLTNEPQGQASLLARTQVGQELAVFDRSYRMTLGEGALDWLYVPPSMYSSVVVAPGEQATIEYDHATRHVVRYVHGSCSKRIALSEFFQTLADTLFSSIICKAREATDIVDVGASRRSLAMQPHFRGEVAWSLLNEAPVEMGFSFEAAYDVRFLGAGVSVSMSPGYLMKPTPEGGLDVALIEGQSNVIVVNDTDGIRAGIQEALENTLPEKLEMIVRDQLVVELPNSLGTSCTATQSGADRRCYDQAMTRMEALCALQGDPVACAGAESLVPQNFLCASNDKCAFRPRIVGVNVMPTELELVLAPDPHDPSNLLSQFYRELPSILGSNEPVCDPPHSGKVANAVVTELLQGETGVTTSPPIACSELGL